MGEMINVYIPRVNHFFVQCPHCRRSTQFAVPPAPERAENPFTYTCPCGQDSQVFMNFRRALRRRVNLTGAITFPRLERTEVCTVDDLSLSGLQCSLFPVRGVVAGQRVLIKLVLDDRQLSRLTLPSVVRRAASTAARLVLGVEFEPLPEFEKQALGFYFM
jgi:hypothetical protein